MSTSTFAANAYRLVQGLTTRPEARNSLDATGLGVDPTAAAAAPEQPNFAAMLRDAVTSVVDQGRVSESKTAAYANGKGNVIDVVTAVAETEVAMETMVAMRDKVISAYEDIMRMPM
ncbi:MAG: flagellar hook-basal body complex protein FliE [Ancalomicrobiaceae bacterium]|nr:flagellar hook-basal body complex protein FliE [Ancalomicrobiaceae bacterium]